MANNGIGKILMKKENTEKLWDKYPEIFEGRNHPITQSLIPFGCECGDGWFDLIDNLCSDINKIIEGTDTKVIAQQVKEKFGGLRFYCYIKNSTDELADKIWERVEKGESDSYKICERCGKKGKARNGGWVRTLCDDCVDN